MTPLEEYGATDSSGFSVSLYDRWIEHKWGSEEKKKRKRWAKAHVYSGCNTNAIISMEVTSQHKHDVTMVKDLIRKAKELQFYNFLADKAYSSREIIQFLDDLGIQSFIPFRKNASGKARGSMVYRKAYLRFMEDRETFLKTYHKRSNAETVFSMLKKRFGNYCRTKTLESQEIELRIRALVHNICLLIHYIYSHSIEIDFTQAGTALGQK